MEKTVKVTLFKDTTDNSDSKYAISVTPLLVTVSPKSDEGEDVIVKWVLVEDPSNPGFPNARTMTASFDATPTPFTIVPPEGTSAPLTENYQTNPGGNGALVTSGIVQNNSVGVGENDSHNYKYTLTVETNDGKTVTLDPTIRVKRKSISKDHLDD